MSFRGSRPPVFAFFLMTTAFVGCASEPVAPPATPMEPHPHVAAQRPPPGAPPTVHPERRCLIPPSPVNDAGILQSSHAADGGAVVVPNAEKVIAALRPSFRACFNRGLANDPTMDGCVAVQLHIAPDGSVGSAATIMKDGLSPDVIGCLESLLHGAAFDPPGGSGSTLNVPIKFVQRGAPAPPNLVAPGPEPTAPVVDEVAGFRFGMTVAEFAERCREVGRPNPLVGNDPRLRSHPCDGVEVEPGMRLNMFLGFCEGDSRLCEINYWTNRNAPAAYRLLEAKLVARYGNAPVQSGNLRVETLEQQCAAGDGKIRRSWWWGPDSAPTGRVLLAFECKRANQSVGVYYDDPSGTAEQVERARSVGAWPGR